MTAVLLMLLRTLLQVIILTLAHPHIIHTCEKDRNSNFMKSLTSQFRDFVNFLDISVNSWNPRVKQWFHEFTENFRDFVKSLISQLYCNIYTHKHTHLHTRALFVPSILSVKESNGSRRKKVIRCMGQRSDDRKGGERLVAGRWRRVTQEGGRSNG